MSNMVVRTNVFALNAHRNMKNVGVEQQRASNRLSSGFRINSAADDAAGLAISENMRAQIRGLDQASRNTQDGQSMILTTEGALEEIGNMLQRVRELLVQASNDTNTQDQRHMIDQEVGQLGREIVSMQNRAEFNTNRVLAMGPQITIDVISQAGQMANTASSIQTWANEAQAMRDIVITAMNLLNEMDPTTLASDISGTQARLINLALGAHTFTGIVPNGLTPEDDSDVAFEMDITAWLADIDLTVEPWDSAPHVDWSLATAAGPLGVLGVLGQDEAGSGGVVDLENVSINVVQNVLAQRLDFLNGTDDGTSGSGTVGGPFPGGVAGFLAQQAEFVQSALRENFLTARNFAEFRTVDSRAIGDQTGTVAVANTGNNLAFFQVGANANQGVFFDFETVSRTVSTAGWTVQMIGSALSAPASGSGIGNGVSITPMIDMVQASLDDVARIRANLGAVSNRMDYTQRSLDISSENLQDAESRVRNADVAREMMAFTMSNVLQQAAVSMLAQANQMPNNLLQLLR